MAHPAYEAVAVTIANGEAVSTTVNVRGRDVVGIQMPADWTAAGMTFQASFDGATFYNIYDTGGTELSYTVADDRYIPVERGKLHGMQALKVRSGTSGTPVNQGGARTLYVILQPHVD